jgi:hypothetical protein
MATAATSLLGLALPVTGELSGTWGTTVNDSLTSLLDTAVAGTTTLNTDADVTLTTTTLAANQARQAILLWTAGGTVTRNITAPAQSKVYVVINASSSTQSIVLRGVGPTTGVTIVQGEKAVCAWNGTDFVKIASTVFAGTLAIANGGSGQTTAQAAMNAFAGAVTSGSYLRGNGTNVVMSAIQAADVPTLNQNTTGSAATFTSTTQNSQFNSIGIGTAASATAGEIRATNNITAYYSDDRLKTKLGSIQDALSKVKALSGFYYEANQTAQDLGYDVVREVGVSAQQVQAVLPEIVVPAPIDDKYLTVRYEKLIPLLIEAIKELDAKVESLTKA